MLAEAGVDDLVVGVRHRYLRARVDRGVAIRQAVALERVKRHRLTDLVQQRHRRQAVGDDTGIDGHVAHACANRPHRAATHIEAGHFAFIQQLAVGVRTDDPRQFHA